MGDVEGHHDRGQAGAEDDLRRPRVDADVEPGGGVMLPRLKQSLPIRTISATRATMAGARWKALAMVVRGRGGPRVTVILWVARKARDLLLRGLVVWIGGTDEGAGIGEGHLPRLTGRFCRVDSQRSREQGGLGWPLCRIS